MVPEAADHAWFDVLARLFPVAGYLRVGAGGGAVRGYGLDAAPRALLVEAEEGRLATVRRAAGDEDGWDIRVAVVAEADGPVTFHRASNPAESGLVAPAALSRLWPNLGLVAAEERPAIRLSTLLAEVAPELAGSLNWLHVDCLPARAVLAGAVGILDRFDVVVVRAVLDPAASDAAGADRRAIDDFMSAHGFRPVAVFAERHPAIGQLVFVRDAEVRLATQIAALGAEHRRHGEAQESRIADLAGELSAERDATRRALGEMADLTVRSEKERDELQARLAGLAADLEAEKQSGEGRAAEMAALQRRVGELQAGVEGGSDTIRRLEGERDALAATAEELKRKLAEEAGARSEVEGRKAEIRRLEGERDALAASAEELRRKLAEAEAARRDLEWRQGLLDREIAKLEAQIELIGSVVLRDQDG